MINKKIIAIGDSLTYGYMIDEPNKWVNLINKKLNLKILNKGINGDTTSGMIYRFKKDVLENNPDIVLIWGGANDFYEEISCEKVIENLLKLIYNCQENNITPIIIISTPVNSEKLEFYPGIDISEIMNNKFEKLIDYFKKEEFKNLYVLDLYSEFRKIQENTDFQQYYIDNIHLSKKGNEKVSEIIGDFLLPIVAN